MLTHFRASVFLTLISACPSPRPATRNDAGTDGALVNDAGTTDATMCRGDERLATRVYFGTRTPSVMPLSAGQILAIGEWSVGCSGTFIADQWVLTANHCEIRRSHSFCVGEDAANPNVCFAAEEVFRHPSQDMTLVRVDAPASSRIAQLIPIPIQTEALTSAIFGTMAEAAGYGTQEDNSSGEREFTAEPIVRFEDSEAGPHAEFIVIDGQGRRGVCFGDSGGPVMILGANGGVRVAGALSWGDPNCIGEDRYSRTDLAATWIESHTGPTVLPGADCGTLTSEGRCVATNAVFCEGGRVRNEACSTCGWDEAARGYRCLQGGDPCGGITAGGSCDNGTARWCERGLLRSRDCTACGQVCGDVPDVGGAYCLPDPCAGLDFHGRCDGDVAVWCADGERRTLNCAERNRRCGWVNDEQGYFCM